MSKKRGPKPKLTAKKKRRLVYYLRIGMSLADARDALGVSEACVRRARRADPKFDGGVKRAAAVGKARHLRRIDRAEKNWQPSAWFLERKYGAEYGQKVKLDHGGRIEVVEEIVRVPAPAHEGNGAAAPGAAGVLPR